MSGAEVLEYIGYLFLAYSTGWGSGFLILSFKKLSDKL